MDPEPHLVSLCHRHKLWEQRKADQTNLPDFTHSCRWSDHTSLCLSDLNLLFSLAITFSTGPNAHATHLVGKTTHYVHRLEISCSNDIKVSFGLFNADLNYEREHNKVNRHIKSACFPEGNVHILFKIRSFGNGSYLASPRSPIVPPPSIHRTQIKTPTCETQAKSRSDIFNLGNVSLSIHDVKISTQAGKYYSLCRNCGKTCNRSKFAKFLSKKRVRIFRTKSQMTFFQRI